jgi:hypothetical protein
MEFKVVAEPVDHCYCADDKHVFDFVGIERGSLVRCRRCHFLFEEVGLSHERESA